MKVTLRIYFFLLVSSLTVCGLSGQYLVKEELTAAINKVRSEGCRCGRNYFKPADPLILNDTLHLSAADYASNMYQQNFFAHIGPDGKNVGQRVDRFGYSWKFIGENLGQGQSDIQELIGDWKRSFTHCKLLMDPRFREMGMAMYKGYWVLHVGIKEEKQ